MNPIHIRRHIKSHKLEINFNIHCMSRIMMVYVIVWIRIIMNIEYGEKSNYCEPKKIIFNDKSNL